MTTYMSSDIVLSGSMDGTQFKTVGAALDQVLGAAGLTAISTPDWQTASSPATTVWKYTGTPDIYLQFVLSYATYIGSPNGATFTLAVTISHTNSFTAKPSTSGSWSKATTANVTSAWQLCTSPSGFILAIAFGGFTNSVPGGAALGLEQEDGHTCAYATYGWASVSRARYVVLRSQEPANAFAEATTTFTPALPGTSIGSGVALCPPTRWAYGNTLHDNECLIQVPASIPHTSHFPVYIGSEQVTFRTFPFGSLPNPAGYQYAYRWQ